MSASILDITKLAFFEDMEGNFTVRAIPDPETKTIWMSAGEMAKLFGRSVRTIEERIARIFSRDTMDRKSVARVIRATADDGKSYDTMHYNLDVILIVGYRTHSSKANQFREWANSVLTAVVTDGHYIDRIAVAEDANKFYTLVAKVKELRTRDAMSMRLIIEIITDASDYVPDSIDAKQTISTLYNMLHYAVHGHTASELIHTRADHTKPLMGLMSFRGGYPTKHDIYVAKNYMTLDEMTRMDELTRRILDTLKVLASKHVRLTMHEWMVKIHGILELTEESFKHQYSPVKRADAIKHASRQYSMYAEQRRQSGDPHYARRTVPLIVDITETRRIISNVVHPYVDYRLVDRRGVDEAIDEIIAILIDHLNDRPIDFDSDILKSVLTSDHIHQYPWLNLDGYQMRLAFGMIAMSLYIEISKVIKVKPPYTMDCVEVMGDSCTIDVRTE